MGLTCLETNFGAIQIDWDQLDPAARVLVRDEKEESCCSSACRSADCSPLEAIPLFLLIDSAAVTLPNWSSEPIDELPVSVRVPFADKLIQGVRRSNLSFAKDMNRITRLLLLTTSAATIVSVC